MIQIPSLRPETRYGIPSADQLLFNRQYIIGYSYLFRQPRWALEIIDPDNEIKNIDRREDSFRTDLRIPEQFRPDLIDFKNSGFDRGHLVASANRRSSRTLNSETFLLSNMSPQHPDLNRKIWRQLEEHVRDLRKHEATVEVYVICGPLFQIGHEIKVIGENHDDPFDIIIPVPHAFFKSILVEDVRGNLDLWSFALPNSATDKDLKDFLRTTTYIEKWAGVSLWDRMSGEKFEIMKNSISPLWF